MGTKGCGDAKKEYMFPFVTVVQCPEAQMISAMGPTFVCSAITGNESFRQRLTAAVHHEGNIVDFLFRARAIQTAPL